MKTAYCFDLDGTVTEAELLPAIAAELGVAEEIETLTRATMDGLISFAQSLRLRAMILGSVSIDAVHAVIADIPLQHDVVQFLDSRPANCFIVTGNLDIWLAPFFAELRCEAFSSSATYHGGRLLVTHVLNKREPVVQLRTRGFERVIAVGDGANDREMFDESDMAIAFGGVHAPSRSASERADFIVHEGGALCRLLAAL